MSSPESKRVKKFRLQLAKEIPRSPNNRATKLQLEQMHLTTLLVTYLNWRIRQVAARPRKVQIEASAKRDKRWKLLSSNINFLINKVTAGQDLTPHLSLEAHKKGFSPTAQVPGSPNWDDKDFLLNVMGFHHFHLGMTYEAKGHIVRTNDVLFAAVSRDLFHVLGIFDHDVFDSAQVSGHLNAERNRLWKIYTDFRASGTLPGRLGNFGVSASGHSTVLVLAAQQYIRIIQTLDPKLDDQKFLQQMYAPAPVPSKPKLDWALNHLDLGLYDQSASPPVFFVFQKGPV